MNWQEGGTAWHARGIDFVDGGTNYLTSDAAEVDDVIGDQVNGRNYQATAFGEAVSQPDSGAHRINSGERGRSCQHASGNSGVSA